jgi:hypothetical protein
MILTIRVLDSVCIKLTISLLSSTPPNQLLRPFTTEKVEANSKCIDVAVFNM